MKKWISVLSLFLSIILFLDWQVSIPHAQSSEESNRSHTTGTVELAFLDIGQGDATLITFPDEQQMLVDCAIDARILEALGRHLPYYDRHIDYLLITHPDKDHYGGCIDVLDRFDVDTILLDGFEKDQSFYHSVMSAIDAENADVIILDQEQTWTIASTSLHFLYPDRAISDTNDIPGTEKENDANNSSIVFILEFAGKRVFMPGDAEEPIEEYLVDTYGNILDVDVYKAGHHGSSGSSHQALIDIVSPSHTIFSAGADNSYGHPSLRIIKRVERAGSRVWRTDQNGDILVTIDDDGIYVETE